MSYMAVLDQLARCFVRGSNWTPCVCIPGRRRDWDSVGTGHLASHETGC